MNSLDFIFTRRSIRHFTSQEITREQEEILLRAAMAAPSCVGNEDWHFTVIRKPENKQKIMKYKPGSADMLEESPLAILISGDINHFYPSNPDYWVQDCSAATENILLAANAMGLGSVWLGIYPNKERAEKIRLEFNMPENLIPFAAVAIGYPAEDKPPRNSFDKTKIQYESF